MFPAYLCPDSAVCVFLLLVAWPIAVSASLGLRDQPAFPMFATFMPLPLRLTR